MSKGGSVYFSTTKKGEVHELKNDLNSLNKEKIKEAVKKVIAAMTVGKDVSALFADVIKSMQTDNLELKKLIYLYIINYARAQPEKAILVVNTFQKDAQDKSSPLIRALAVRTMGCIRVDRITDYLADPLAKALKDSDPYVRKTAAVCVAKLYDINSELVEDQGFLDLLRNLISDSNAMVVTNAVAALSEIANSSGKDVLNLNAGMLAKLMAALNECTEWGQVFVMDTLAKYHPEEKEAKDIIERVTPRLKHANCAVSLAALRVIMAYLPRVSNKEFTSTVINTKLPPPLITLTVHHSPEVQYVALRNINLIVQKHPGILANDIKHFFVKYNDPLYVKSEKLEIMIKLTNQRNIDKVLMELSQYASEIDVVFVKQAVRAIGRVAVKIEKAAKRCITSLLNLIDSKDDNRSDYVLQEAIVVIKDIFRKYPNKYESIITVLIKQLDSLSEPSAIASMVWIIGEYADRINEAPDLLEAYVESFAQEDVQVQLQLLTAVVKLFLKRPDDAKNMVTQVLGMATKSRDNPDLRDRGYVYWRLLSTDPAAAQAVVLAARPPITDDENSLDPELLDVLIANISTLSSVYHKAPEIFLKDHKKNVVFKKRDRQVGSDSDSGSDSGSSDSESSDSDSDSDDDDDEKKAAPVKTQPAPQPQPTQPAMIDIFGMSAGPAVAAPQTPAAFVLRNGQADGLQISSSYKRTNGQPTLTLTFQNNGNGTLSSAQLRLDGNVLGLVAGALKLPSAVGPGQTVSVDVALSPSGQPVDKNNRGLWIAVKQNLVTEQKGVIYLRDTSLSSNFHIMFEENGAVGKDIFLRTWPSIQSSNERSGNIADRKYNGIEDIKSRLTSNNVFFLALRKTPRGDSLYFSLSLRGTPVLIELTVNGAAVVACVRSKDPLCSEISLAALQNLLTT